MRKVLSIICALILTALFPAAWLVSKGLPTDTGDYIAQKYAGWNGVLQAWVCCEWKPAGSFISWLNRCAAQFEKAHDGVYIEFTPVDVQAMRGIGSSGVRSPELVFFSPGVFTDAAQLAQIEMPSALRAELAQETHALPVAMGGTIWVLNSDLADTVDPSAVIIPDGWEAAVEALLSGSPVETPIEQPGLDLGLPAFSESGLSMEETLERFMEGDISCMPATQAEITRLVRLMEEGRGPDWKCVAAGEYACTDQLLLAGLTTGDGERYTLAREFALELLQEENQAALANAGAFSVTGRMVHPPHSPYAPLDALLNSRPLRTASAFSEHSIPSAAAIVPGLPPAECS